MTPPNDVRHIASAITFASSCEDPGLPPPGLKSRHTVPVIVPGLAGGVAACLAPFGTDAGGIAVRPIRAVPPGCTVGLRTKPLLITPDGTVVAGHRRLAAARRVGLADVPVVVRALSPVEQLAAQLTENLQRSDLTPIEEARAYRHFLQLLAIKLRQMEGATLAAITKDMHDQTGDVLERRCAQVLGASLPTWKYGDDANTSHVSPMIVSSAG